MRWTTMAADRRIEPMADPARSSRGLPMPAKPAPFRAHLLPVAEYWVVHVPEAADVHALVLDVDQADGIARRAIATVLDIDPAEVEVEIDTH